LKLPTRISRDTQGDSLTMSLEISEDLDCFRGHFPGIPVLPGVVQLHWAVEISREHFGLTGVPCDIRRLKFKNVVTPPATVELALTRTGPNETRFEFSGDGKTYSQGRLGFSGPTE